MVNESNQTDTYTNGFTKQLDLLKDVPPGSTIATGDSCWLLWHMVAGPNKESGDNFTFDAASDSNVSYSITGGVLDPSFHQQG
ncbi:hypothetical protein BE20_00015 [Sorangium cellulosum]|uniref:Uncharacterized protein n=1 Tax=Sorangium cellulosum TaxID=56 RepID=A0A150RUE6_SORCE|nr:hypothetical protein BE18_35135 [Sorangium cellulosum]KYF99605.1 hypothetical protein BE20_00015 [Sorangium cellulosum]